MTNGYDSTFERMAVALEAANVGVWDWRIDTGQAVFDDHYYRMAGYEPGAFPGTYEAWRSRIHAEDVADVETRLHQHLAGEHPTYRVEFRFQSSDGGWIWLEAKGRIVERDAAGDPLRMVGIHADITDRRTADERIQAILRATEVTLGPEFFKTFVGHLAATLDMKQVFVGEVVGDGGAAVRSLAVYTDGVPDQEVSYELEGTPCREVVDGGSRVFRERVQADFPGDRILSDLGAEGYIGVPLRDDTGAAVGVIVLLSARPLSEATVARVLPLLDVFSPRAAAELMRLRVERDLRHVQRLDAIGQLAGGIAHDFNNMLGGILGYADLLSMQIDPGSEALEYAEGIARAAERAGALTAQLLAFSRKGILSVTSFDVHAEIRAACNLLEHTLDRRISVETSLEAEHSTIRGDAAQIQSAILNLGINARDAMPEGGRLRVRTSDLRIVDGQPPVRGLVDGDYIMIDVVDTGVGIAPELVDRIFDPYFTTKGVGKGTGLGLAAVYGTVREHRGQIMVRSRQGAGTTFTLYLPAAEAAASNGAAAADSDIAGRTVLIIDDEDLVRGVIRTMLVKAGCRVLEAGDGAAGVAVFAARHPRIDAVILDMAMPVMGGAECFRRLREIRPDARIIVASGFADGAVIDETSTPDRAGLLHKPFRRKELLATLRTALATAPGS